jgi:co-chaperonin GroES (HSP10)
MDTPQIKIFGNRILVRPLKVLDKAKKKKSSIIAPDSFANKKSDQPQRYNYDDHKFQAEVQRISLNHFLRTFFLPRKFKIRKGDIVYYIGGDGFPVVQDDNDYLVLEAKRIIGVNEKGRQGYEYMNFKDS